MKTSKLTAFAFFLPFLAGYVLFKLVPLVFGVFLSFTNMNLAKRDFSFVGLDNYAAILTDPANMHHISFFQGFFNTLLFVVISVPVLLVVSLGLALLIDAAPERTKRVFRTMFFVAYAVSVSAVSVIFLQIFETNGGLLNGALRHMGLISQPIEWIKQQPNAWFVILISTVWWTVGYNMILFINALNDIDVSIYEAAYIDGANYYNRFRYIILPNIGEVMAFVLFTTTISSFNLYGQPFLITQGGPLQSTNTITIIIRQTIIERNLLGVGSAMSVIFGIILTVLLLGQNWLQSRRSQLKGR